MHPRLRSLKITAKEKKNYKVVRPERSDGSDGLDVAKPKDTALIDHAPTADKTKPALLASPEEAAAAAATSEKAADIAPSTIDPILANAPQKTSEVVELVNKRYGTLTKKLVRLPLMSFCEAPCPGALRVMSTVGRRVSRDAHLVG